MFLDFDSGQWASHKCTNSTIHILFISFELVVRKLADLQQTFAVELNGDDS